MKDVRPVDAVYIRRKVVQMHDRLQRKPRSATSSAALAALEAVQSIIDKTVTLKLEPKKLYASCDGCAWNGVRHQKCTCCSRNTRMKDNFKAMEV